MLSRRTVCAAVVGLAAAALVGVPGTRAQAASCTAPSVAVVVDFGHFGGGIQRGCVAPGGTGLQVLAAVFAVTQVQREPGFVCRINGLPTQAQDACINTPPSNAYWAYFHGRAGSGWVYSAGSAATYVPPPGTVEGWAFGGGAPPGVSVASVLPTKPAPSPTHPRPKPTHAPTHRASAPGTTAAATSAPTHSASARPKPSRSTSPSAHPTSEVPSGSAPPTVEDVTQRPATAASSGSGSAAPLVMTVALVAGLLAGSWYVSRRRRLSR